MIRKKEVITNDGEIINTPFLYTPHNYNKTSHTLDSAIYCDPELDRAQQQYRDECNINFIMKDYGVTGVVPQRTTMPMQGNYTEEINDYQTAANMIREAQESFAELPAQVRKRFHNNPQELLEFVMDDNNIEEARKLGLIQAATAPEAPPAEPEPKAE